jgi:hypothetical protein
MLRGSMGARLYRWRLSLPLETSDFNHHNLSKPDNLSDLACPGLKFLVDPNLSLPSRVLRGHELARLVRLS